MTVSDLLSDYEKAIPLLSIDESHNLHEQLNQISEKSRDNEYFVKGKLQEKDNEIKELTEKYGSMQAQLHAMLSIFDSLAPKGKNELAEKLVKNRLYVS